LGSSKNWLKRTTKPNLTKLSQVKLEKRSILTGLTWQWWFGFRLKQISANDRASQGVNGSSIHGHANLICIVPIYAGLQGSGTTLTP